MEYFKASPDVVATVQEIATEHHKRLGGARIAVLMQDTAAKHHGKVVIATASLPPARMKPLLDGTFAFVICIAQLEWDDLSSEQRRAVVDHELCHCAFGDDCKPRMKGHDYEEFAEVVARHGFWRKDLSEQRLQGALFEQGITVETLRAAGE